MLVPASYKWRHVSAPRTSSRSGRSAVSQLRERGPRLIHENLYYSVGDVVHYSLVDGKFWLLEYKDVGQGSSYHLCVCRRATLWSFRCNLLLKLLNYML